MKKKKFWIAEEKGAIKVSLYITTHYYIAMEGEKSQVNKRTKEKQN